MIIKSDLVFLIGFMASGKSTIGKKIAKELGYNFTDTDNYIEQKTGISISEIFKEVGERGFRKLETQSLKEIIARGGRQVISTGGGMPCNHYRLNRMLKSGTLIYLEIDTKSVIHRLKNAKVQRPLLAGLSEIELERKIETLLNKRRRYYEQAHHTISSLEAKKTIFYN
ncbi:MAG: shikimate kinase [Flavobacteriales bacterium]